MENNKLKCIYYNKYLINIVNINLTLIQVIMKHYKRYKIVANKIFKILDKVY